MKTINLVKSFCLVLFLVVGISFSANAECKSRNIEDVHGKVHCSAVSCDPCDCSCSNFE